MKEKEAELTAKLEDLQKEFGVKKVELRIAERKLNENKEHMSYLRQMNKEDREKKEALEKEVTSKSEELALLKSKFETSSRREKELDDQVTFMNYGYIFS